MRYMAAAILIFSLLAPLSSFAADHQIVVQMPAGAKVKSAAAVASGLKLDSPGSVEGDKVVFPKLLPDTPYDLKITLEDGTIYWGVDMGWYGLEAAKPDAKPMDDEDREEIRKVLQDVEKFYNKVDILLVNGTHDRATVLIQPIRDVGFHSDKGGEVIWRIELQYFKNQHGGWEAVSQVNKVIRRERFKSQADYHKEADRIRWTPQLGGIKLKKDEASRAITLQPNAAPATAPAEAPKKTSSDAAKD